MAAERSLIGDIRSLAVTLLTKINLALRGLSEA
jgi:hypothetical protein